MLISGAMGMFDRETVIRAGGYNVKTVGEDMELVLRMRRYMAEHKQNYEVTYIPDPLCWTEVPSDLRSMRKQRTRWTRGLIESLWSHRKMMSMPDTEDWGCLVIHTGYCLNGPHPSLHSSALFIQYTLPSRSTEPAFLLLLFLFVYSFAVSLTTWAVLFEEITFHKYPRKRDVLRLIGTAMLEPFFYPVHTYFAVRGNLESLRGKKGWGKAERSGFQNKKKPATAAHKQHSGIRQ
jgi:cellulose synthase/poly-beta-1,6-N-acetylglucosamine synthase-like glycosyltransferase